MRNNSTLEASEELLLSQVGPAGFEPHNVADPKRGVVPELVDARRGTRGLRGLVRSFPRQVEAARLQPASPDPSGFRIAAASSVVTLSGNRGMILGKSIRIEGIMPGHSKSIRTAKLDLRLSPEAKQKLQAAASVARCSVSEFVLDMRWSAPRRRWRTVTGSGSTRSVGRHSWKPWTPPTRDLPRLSRLFQEPSVFDDGTTQ